MSSGSGAFWDDDKSIEHEVVRLRVAVKKLEGERNELLAEVQRLRKGADSDLSKSGPRLATMPLPQRLPTPTQPYVPAAFRDEPPTGGPPAREDRASFDASSLKTLRADQLDGLPYGLVVLDREGAVLQYNDTESRMAKLPKDQVIGRNFFRDIAPCTGVAPSPAEI